jgi:ketosteroid isomerase-like protein
MDSERTEVLLDVFVAAWNAHDIEGLIGCMCANGTFYGSAGGYPRGTMNSGPEALRKAYSDIWRAFPDARWNEPNHIISGDRAVTEWIFTGTSTDGKHVEVRGCDLFLIRDGKIAVKDTYRKKII